MTSFSLISLRHKQSRIVIDPSMQREYEVDTGTHYLTRVHGISHHVDPPLEGRHLEQADIGRQDAVKVDRGVDPLCVPVTSDQLSLC